MTVNADAVRRIGEGARQLIEQGNLEDAAAYLQAAARAAWLNQPGGFALPELDTLAGQIAERALPPWAAGSRTSRHGRPRVLHVITEVYASGGHTRLAARWIARDRKRDHTVVLTRQHAAHPSFKADLDRSDAAILSVGNKAVPILERARGLRAMAATFDCVVAHIHPDDAGAVIALQPGPSRPPTLFMNHADVAPWMGAQAFDVLVGFRRSARIIEELRGIAHERCVRVPLACDPPAATPPSRAAARQRLGIPADAEIILTVGHYGKFAPLTEHSLADAVMPTLEARPAATVIAVGPTADQPPWNHVIPRAGHRLIAAGVQTDLTDYYAAADVLLESYPIGGGTVVMEAALAGLPVVSYRPAPLARELFWQEPIGDPDPRLHAGDPAELLAHISLLLDDPAERTRRADTMRDLTLDLHAGRGWTEQLESAYARAIELTGGPEPEAPSVPVLSDDDDLFPMLWRYNHRSGGSSPPQVVNASARALELAASSPAIRARFPDLQVDASSPLPEPFSGVIAAPPLDESAITEQLRAMRELRSIAVVAQVALGLPRDELERAIALVEPILAEEDARAGFELDVDVVPYDGAGPPVSPDWLAIATEDDGRAWWDDAPVHRLTRTPAHV
ncbi:MAG: glycosyltransferase family 4 protein [Solirubrobacteraceae bacterium]|nr:glycosyltransferase family 4 protein [Solirubrobacteraceae bacterium]